MVLGVIVGVIGAFFLYSLQWAYETRNSYRIFIWLLPVSGFLVGYIYDKWGKTVAGGNNLILEQINQPKDHLKWYMAPFILFGTILTHLGGGSAGREGTAVQIGASAADQISKLFKNNTEARKIMLQSGIAAGFASVFGTPLAGLIFAFEVSKSGKTNYSAIFPAAMSAIVANFVTELFHLPHTHYVIGTIPELSATNILWSIFAGVCFGFAGIAFSLTTKYSALLFQKINYAPLRPFVGGLIFVAIVFFFGYENTERFHGLGIEHMVESFENKIPSYDFGAKIFLTAIILGSGFKGGEVTPLFFTGATLGNALSQKIIPLPTGLLAGMGFVAVFSAAANTPIATIFMGIELFGSDGMYYIAIACITAYLISGKTGIYKSQEVGKAKSLHLSFLENKRID